MLFNESYHTASAIIKPLLIASITALPITDVLYLRALKSQSNYKKPCIVQYLG